VDTVMFIILCYFKYDVDSVPWGTELSAQLHPGFGTTSRVI